MFTRISKTEGGFFVISPVGKFIAKTMGNTIVCFAATGFIFGIILSYVLDFNPKEIDTEGFFFLGLTMFVFCVVIPIIYAVSSVSLIYKISSATTTAQYKLRDLLEMPLMIICFFIMSLASSYFVELLFAFLKSQYPQVLFIMGIETPGFPSTIPDNFNEVLANALMLSSLFMVVISSSMAVVIPGTIVDIKHEIQEEIMNDELDEGIQNSFLNPN